MESKIIEYYKNPKLGLMGVDGIQRKMREDGIKVSKKEVKEALSKVESYSLNRAVKRRGRTRKTIAKYPHQQWQADLVEMDVPAGAPAKENDGVRYLITVIDVFSRYAWVRTLKNKTGAEITKAFSSIIDEGAIPVKLQTDKGSEFYNKTFDAYLNSNNIELFSTHGDGKATMIERFNRTLKARMGKLFDVNQSFRYVDDLQDMVDGYNNAYHGTIKMSPREAIKPENILDVYEAIVGEEPETVEKPAIKKGMYVRIPAHKDKFTKEWVGQWTIEVFIIDKVLKTQPPTYHIKDQKGEVIQGSYYERELQVVPKEVAMERRIEKIIDKKIVKGEKKVLVRWLGYGEKFDEWIPEENVKTVGRHTKLPKN